VAEAGEGTVHVAPLAKWKHLMDPHARQLLRVGLQGVEDRERLGVEHAGDEIVSLVDVFQYRLWLTPFLGQRRMDRRWVSHCLVPDRHPANP